MQDRATLQCTRRGTHERSIQFFSTLGSLLLFSTCRLGFTDTDFVNWFDPRKAFETAFDPTH
jgi:hypothetical protein